MGEEGRVADDFTDFVHAQWRPSCARRWASQLVLRRITTDDPRRNGVPEYQHRLTWLLLLTPHELARPLGGPCCHHRGPPAGVARDISVYDALTGKFVWGSPSDRPPGHTGHIGHMVAALLTLPGRCNGREVPEPPVNRRLTRAPH